MKTMRYQTQSLLLASLLTACVVQAGPIIYDNGAPFIGGRASDVALTFGGGAQEASNFALGAENVLADIHWWGGYNFSSAASSADNFTIYIYNDSAGSPGTVAHTIPVGNPGRTPTGSMGGNAGFAYEYDLVSPITLTSGVTYWLSILNDTTSDPGGEWFWAASNAGNGNDQSRLLNSGSPGPWTPNPAGIATEFAYNLTGPNPAGPSTSVPDGGSTLPLLGLALSGLTWLHRRSR